VIGCVQDLTYHPNFALQNPKLKVYRWNRDKSEFEFAHETEVEAIPMVLEPWNDKVLAGVGNCLRLYEIGKKRMLKKA
jgi:splicing factor 3B subunit 3